ncbi:MAG: class I mannose-6-phosphate isomerase [Clostridia bacterium]|nr:class I mannose-6-phosphate isomerase [Clostridia bacterium]
MLILSTVSKSTIWGSNRLYSFGGDSTMPTLGQLYTAAGNEELSSTVMNGQFAGQSLYQVYRDHPELFGYDKYEGFPLLIGFVDACENLSIQIHPHDEYAQTVEGKPFGKNESWLFLEAPEAGAIINGCKCADMDEVHQKIEAGDWDGIIDHLPVKQNDYVYVQSGTLHALTAGSLVYEIQQSTDITYRFWDYDRTDAQGNKRPLQLEKAVDVIDVAKRSESIPCEKEKVYRHPYYSVTVTDVCGSMCNAAASFCVVTLLEGAITTDGHTVRKGSSLILFPGETIHFEGSASVVVAQPL